MAEYHHHHEEEEEAVKFEESAPAPYESTERESERGLFESRTEEEEEKAVQEEFEEKLLVSESKPPHGHGVVRSSSEEEQVEEVEKMKEKLAEYKDGEEDKFEDTNVPVENIHADQEEVYLETSDQDNKQQGLVDEIKEKQPGQHKEVADDDMDCPPPTPAAAAAAVEEEEGQGEQQKKGFLDKIKDKIPGFHSKPSSPQQGQVA